MIRVLHITRDFPPRWIGGLSTAVGQMVRAQVELGVDCAVLSFDDWRPHARPADQPLSHDVQLGAQVGRLRGPRALEAAAQLARDLSPSVIHVHHAMLWPFASRLRAELNAPVVKSIHVAQARQNALRGVSHTASLDAQRHALNEADAIIAPSEAAAEAVLSDVPSARPRVIVIPLAVFDTERAVAAAAAPEQRDPRLLVYAGRFSDINGTAELWQALPEILERHPTCRAVIAGGLPANRKSERKWIRRWKQRAPPDVAARTEFRGWLAADQLGELYATCGVLIAPSWFETFGLVVLEAMLHGAPIAASRSGGVESMLSHLESGYLFEPQNPPAIVDATCALIRDRHTAQSLGRNAARVARTAFCWPVIAPRLVRVYESLGSRHTHSLT